MNDVLNQALNDEQVIAYLEQHPDFFSRHASLATQLEVQHESGATYSLVQHKLNLLTKENAELKSKLKHIHQIASDNEHLLTLCLQLTHKLLASESLEEALDLLNAQFKEQFNMPQVSIKLFAQSYTTEQQQRLKRLLCERQHAEALLTSDMLSSKPFCGIIRDNQLHYLFGDDCQPIASVAIIPLGVNAELGIIALGGESISTFTAEMDTLFLGFISTLLGQMFPKWLTLTA